MRVLMIFLIALSTISSAYAQYYDGETGLHYNYRRDYEPESGRYIESDPIGLDGGLNTYEYVMGNPVKWTDTFGLFVDASYNTQTGKLTVIDSGTGQVITTEASSGGKPFGEPIPVGTYDILERDGRPGFYRLDSRDNRPYNDVHEPSGRDHFRLHHPGRTIGCVAADNWEDWEKVDAMIRNTKKTDQVPDNFKPWWKIWPTNQEYLKRYGTLYVY